MAVEIAGTSLYTLKDLSERLNVSVATLRGYIEKGRLHATRVGRSYRVTGEALQAFLQSSSLSLGPRPGPPEDDPILRVAGIGADGALTHHIDRELYS
jgi:excisionase family DNA binding protein